MWLNLPEANFTNRPLSLGIKQYLHGCNSINCPLASGLIGIANDPDVQGQVAQYASVCRSTSSDLICIHSDFETVCHTCSNARREIPTGEAAKSICSLYLAPVPSGRAVAQQVVYITVRNGEEVEICFQCHRVDTDGRAHPHEPSSS